MGTTDNPVMVSLESDGRASLVSHIQKITSKTTADSDAVDLITCTLPVHFDPTGLMVDAVLKQCATNDEELEAAESRNLLRKQSVLRSMQSFKSTSWS